MRKPTGVTAMVVMLGVFLMGGTAPAKTTSESMPEPIQKLPVLGSIQWQNQPLPFVPAGPRAGISGSGMVVHGGQIYLMGGFIPAGDETESTSRRTSHWTHRYDLQTGKWDRLADMPGRREYTRAIVAGDAIYIMGGGSQGVGAARRYAPFRDCFRLDLSRDPPVWTEHSQLTVARTHMGTGLIGTNLLVVAGGNEYSRDVKGYHKSTIRDTVDVFDLSQPGRGWQKRAPLPGARGWVASSVSGGRLYVFGGLSFLASNSQIRFRDGFRYDVKQDRWESRAAFPLPISGWEAATLKERFIIAVGGVLLEKDRPIQDATPELVEHTYWNDLPFGYDTREDRWYRLEGPMPGGGVFNDPGVCIVGDVIYVVGAEGPKGSHFNHFLKGRILLKRDP